jgi:3',5'-cyclic AMP phosphodiesterase CpdA
VQMRTRFVARRRIATLIPLFVLVALVLTIGGFGWAAEQLPAYPQARFAVMSDLHVFDESLGHEGPLYQQYIDSDRKLLLESVELFESAVSRLCGEGLDFVVVSGDLTKDGERLNHERCAGILSQLTDSGTQVYVVPGNHDIMNGYAVSFTSHGADPVPSVTPSEFEEIYREMGYGQAIRRDPASLSYVAEPLPGLWLIAMDACRYSDNQQGSSPVVDGRFSEATLRWLDGIMDEAIVSGSAVLGVMHHGVIEHFDGQERFYGEYLVDDWPMIGERLAVGGMRAVFTGHFHSQDIVKRTYTTKAGGQRRTVFLFDIETGSLATYPCPYRIIEITSDQIMRVRSRVIDRIPSHPEGFTEYAKAFTHEGIASIAFRTLCRYRASAKSAQIIAPQVADAALAHYAGDEAAPNVLINTSGVGLWTKLLVWLQRRLVNGLWNDLMPPDNNVDLNLSTGEWSLPSYD